MTNEFPCVMNIWIITIKLNIMHCHLLLCYTFSFKKGEYLISIYLYVFIGCNVWDAPFRVTLTKKLSLSDISYLNLQTVSDNWQYLQTFSQSWKFRSQYNSTVIAAIEFFQLWTVDLYFLIVLSSFYQVLYFI